MREKITLGLSSMFFTIGLFLVLFALMINWGIRNEVIQLREWKATYESGYCPTCGAKMVEPQEGEDKE